MNDDRRRVLKATGTGLAAALAGCIGGGSGGTESTSGSDSSGGSTKLIFWNAFFDEQILEPWTNWYKETAESEHNLTLQLEPFAYEDLRKKYLTGARTGKPDMIQGVLSHISAYTKADLMEPLGDYVQNKDNFDGYYDNTLNALKYQDELYGLPLDGNGRALLYRKDILEEYGFEPPSTVEEFHEIGREINKSEDGMAGYQNCTKAGGVRAFQEWISHVYQHEDNLYAVDGDTWTVVPSADTLGVIFDNWYAQVWDADQPLADPKNLGSGWQALDSGYAKGNFAMMENGPWVKSSQAEAGPNAETILNENTAVTHLPRAENASKGTYLEVEWAGLNAQANSKDAAWKALDLYTSNESYQRFAENDPGNWATPIHQSVESTFDDEDWMPFVDVFKTGKALSFISWGSTQEAFFESMQRVAYGRADPYEEAKQFHAKLQDIAQNELKV